MSIHLCLQAISILMFELKDQSRNARVPFFNAEEKELDNLIVIAHRLSDRQRESLDRNYVLYVYREA